MTTRRQFLKQSTLSAIGTLVMPWVVPASVWGASAPSNLINVGFIGTGRISRSSDIPSLIKSPKIRAVAVCDLDRHRVAEAKSFVDSTYTKLTGKTYNGTTTYQYYSDLLANNDVDAVCISTPDHWHAKACIDAVYAQKDVYLQKPMSLTLDEGRKISDAVNRTGRVFQIGSQYRSVEAYRRGCELIRNGRIGEVKELNVYMPVDPAGGKTDRMEIPRGFDYDTWLGSTPEVYYTEDRVHPQQGYDRPGWLRCEQFGAGMITGWGAHLFDIVQWALDTEHTGPVEVSGRADFPKEGLWNVHGNFNTEMIYANGVKVTCSQQTDKQPAGILFTGTNGTLRIGWGGVRATPSDPLAIRLGKTLQASDPSILGSELGADEIHLYRSEDHHLNWVDCIISRQRCASTAEIAHRTNSVCLLQHLAMKLGRTLYWNPQTERFVNDNEANTLIARPQRAKFAL